MEWLGKMEAGDIVSSREQATAGITKSLTERLSPHGINIVLVNIANIDYSDAFERAVEEKQVALQQSQKEKNNTARLREVAEQEVVKAEAEASPEVRLCPSIYPKGLRRVHFRCRPPSLLTRE